MRDKKQHLLLEFLISHKNTFALCKSILKPEYFDPEYRQTVSFLNQYYDKFNSLPTVQQIEAETDTAYKTHEITQDQVQYCAEEVEKFCKRKAIELAILSSPALLEKQKHEEIEQSIRDALTVSLNKDMGIDYFGAIDQRIATMLESPPKMSTGYSELDDMLGGGIGVGELIIFAAGSGGGKSITIANLGLNFIEQGKDVLYITLELSELLVSQRYDQMITSISSVAWKSQHKTVQKVLKTLKPDMGRLTVKYMPAQSPTSKIRAYLKEYELTRGKLPAILIVDYLDIVGSTEHISADNVFEKDKRVAEELRNIGSMYGMSVITASQLNRSAVDAPSHNQGMIAGGMSKINTADNVVSITLNDGLKTAGEILFQFLKTRNSDGVGKSMILGWDNDRLRITNKTSPAQHDVDANTGEILNLSKFKKDKPAKLPNAINKFNLLDVMNVSDEE